MDSIEETVSEHTRTLESHAAQLQRHETILVGVKDCEDNGLVNQVRNMKETMEAMAKLLEGQKTYNKILLFFAGLLASAVFAYMWSVFVK